VLVSHGCNTKLQPIKLGKTGRDDRDFHSLLLTCPTVAGIP
jgi:hypothetical protein